MALSTRAYTETPILLLLPTRMPRTHRYYTRDTDTDTLMLTMIFWYIDTVVVLLILSSGVPTTNLEYDRLNG